MDKSIDSMSIQELKALAYDQLGTIEIASNNLKAIRQRISNMENNHKEEKK